VEALYEEAHALALGRALPRLLISVELSGAGSASEVDQHSVAEKRIRDAIERTKSSTATAPVGSAILVPEPSLAELHRCWGDVVRHAGDLERAIEIYQRGQKAGRDGGDPLGATWCLSEIGITWQQLGEADRATSILDEAAKEAEALGDHEAALRWRMRLQAKPGKLLFLSGFNRLSYAMARLSAHGRHDEEAERIARELVTEAGNGQPDLECAARNLLAACYQRRGALHQAITTAKVAVKRADATDRPLLAIQFRTNLATYYVEAKQLLLAEQIAQEAVELGERLRDDAATSEIRQAIGAGLAGSYELLILLAAEDLTTREANVARVAELGQRFQTRNLNRWLTLTNLRISVSDSRLTDAVRNYVTTETLVEASASRGLSLTQPLEAHHRAVEVLHSLALDYPTIAAAQQQGVLNQVAKHLPTGTAALDLIAIEAGIVCTWVADDGRSQVAHILWSRTERHAWRERWEESMSSAVKATLPSYLSRSAWRMAAEAPAAAGIVAPPLAACYDEVDQHLFDPILRRFEGECEHLLVSASSELFFLPFVSLGRSLGARVSFVPSLTSIGILAERPPSDATASYMIGDGSFTLTLVPFELEHLVGFQELQPRPECLQDIASSARRIHFAGHGQFDPSSPYGSGIVLEGNAAPPLSLPSSFPGCILLTIPGIIFSLDLPRCELAVMSACSTGIPRMHAASEFTSVPAAFMIAGARNVVAAAWPAHDGGTALLMQEFYAALNESGGSPSRALEIARRSLGMMEREEAIRRLGSETIVPEGDRPFNSPLFLDAFRHYGIN
jgi:tetratricopeptide (TPR) repeat protein